MTTLDAEALSVLATTPMLVRSMIAGMPGSFLAPQGDNWGPRQVLEHLLDTEAIAFRSRIRRIVEEDDPRIQPIDPSARLVEGGYAGRELDDLLDWFEQARAESLRWLHSLSPDALERTGEHEVAGTISAAELVSYWATHDLIHLRQLTRALQDRFLPRIGNMHAFLED